MNTKPTLKALLLAGLIALLPAISQAQDDDWITGGLSLDFNTHFMSYGADVWGAGTELDDILFNPSFNLNFDLGNGANVFMGTWFDINDNAETSIGDELVQEVDVWVGTSFDATEDVNVTLQYQEWMYGGQSERIVDGIFAYDHDLSPSLTLHGRIDGEGLDNGLVGVLGISPSYDIGGQSVSFPINVAANTDDFHGGDGGFTFANIGASTSFDIAKDTSLNVGATYFYTDEDSVPNNPDDSFVTLNAGIGWSF